MSMRYQAGFLTASYFPLKVPDAPTAVTATMASSTSVSVAFTAPADVGGGAVTSYLVVSSGGQTASGSSSPVVVTGLTTGTAYTFVVYAINAFGTSPASAASNSVTPVAQGQQAFVTAGTYSWIAPAGVTSVSVVAVGGGGNTGPATYACGGGLGYKNNISVVPGNSYAVVVGAAQGTSYFINTSTVRGGGGSNVPGTYTGDGGGTGGNSFSDAGGGGAGGYAGNGGDGNTYPNNGTNGAGGGGAGGGGFDFGGYINGGCGGGVGILGQGANGVITTTGDKDGGGGSGGANGTWPTAGGLYGGGAGVYISGGTRLSVSGGGGAVRIIWPGTTRSFPSTNTGDL